MSDADVRAALHVLKRHGFTIDDLIAEFPEIMHHEVVAPPPEHRQDDSQYFGLLHGSVERWNHEATFRWRNLARRIPEIQLGNYLIKPLPPYGGMAFRWRVNGLSIYLDTEGVAGAQTDYWEVYPVGDDVARFDIDDVEGLVNCINKNGRGLAQ